MLFTQGQYFLPDSTSVCLVKIQFEDTKLKVRSLDTDEVIHQQARDSLLIQPKLGATVPREINLDNNGLVSFNASKDINVWLDAHSKFRFIDRLENNSFSVGAALVLIPLILFALFRFVIPYSADQIAPLIPQSAIEKASQEALRRMDNTLLQPSSINPAKQKNLIRLIEELENQLPTQLKLTLLFRQSDRLGANALALPDGTIILTDEFVKLIGDNDEQIKAVLLHEIGHIHHMHGIKNAAQSISTSLVLTYLFGDVSGLSELGLGIFSTVLNNQFSQKHEWEADNFSLEYSDKVHISEQALADALSNLMNATTSTNRLAWLSSHPSLQSRITQARREHVSSK